MHKNIIYLAFSLRAVGGFLLFSLLFTDHIEVEDSTPSVPIPSIPRPPYIFIPNLTSLRDTIRFNRRVCFHFFYFLSSY